MGRLSAGGVTGRAGVVWPDTTWRGWAGVGRGRAGRGGVGRGRAGRAAGAL